MSTVLPSASRFLVSAPLSHALWHRLRHIYGLLEDVLRWHSCLVWFQIIRPISIVNLLFSTVFDEMRYITLKMHSWEETASKHMVNELVWQLVWLIESGHESQDRPYCKAYPGCTTCVFAIEVAEAADHTGDRFPDGGEDIIVYLKWNDNVQATLVAWRALPWMVKFVRPRPFAFQTEGADKGCPRTSIIALLVTQVGVHHEKAYAATMGRSLRLSQRSCTNST